MTTKLIQLSDIHFGREDARAIDLAAEFIHDVAPDGVIVCGDLTQRGKTREFAAARAWIDTLPGEKLVVAGNHDTPLLNMAARVLSPFERFMDHFGDLIAPQTFGGLCIKGLNTARGWQARRNWAEGSVDLDDLGDLMEPVSADVIVCHHPFMSMPDAPLRTRTRRGRRAHSLLAGGSPRMLLTGHVHTPSVMEQRTELGGYLAISAGTLSTRLRDAPPSFNLLTCDEERLAVDVLDCQQDGVARRPLGEWELSALIA